MNRVYLIIDGESKRRRPRNWSMYEVSVDIYDRARDPRGSTDEWDADYFGWWDDVVRALDSLGE